MLNLLRARRAVRSAFALALLPVILLCSACTPLPTPPRATKALPIDARLGSFIIEHFDKSRIQQRTLKSMGSVEGVFRDQLHALLRRGGMFNPASGNTVHLRAELLSWRDASFSPLDPDMEVVVRYTLRDENDTVLMERAFTSNGQSSPLWLVAGIYRNIRAANQSFAANVEQFGKAFAEEFPVAWSRHLDSRRSHHAAYQSSSLPPISKPSIDAPVVPSAVKGLGRYHALVIGNNDYANLPRLQTAVNDAESLARVLKSDYAFNVTLLKDASRADILRALNDYRFNLSEQDNLLIFYAGHGWLDSAVDEGYWLPVDADRRDSTNWISNATIAGTLRAMQAKHVLVVADSCYAGKLTRGIKIVQKTPDYFKEIADKRSRTVLASGGLEPVADDGGRGNHSIFSSELLRALQENNGLMDGALLHSRIQRPVVLNSDQSPEYSDIRKAGHSGGDFIFAKAI